VDVMMATSPGHPGRSNEDFVGAVPGAAVLLDGAGIPGTESICHHGVAWYTRRLGGALLGSLSVGDGRGLSSVLADAIDQLAAEHRRTCDIADPSSPQATVALVRVDGERAEYLVLADSYVLLGGPGDNSVVVTDGREVALRRSCLALLDGLEAGPQGYGAARETAIGALRARRNQPGGYWIAKDDPRAAEEAVTGAVPRRGPHPPRPAQQRCGARHRALPTGDLVRPAELVPGQRPGGGPPAATGTRGECRRRHLEGGTRRLDRRLLHPATATRHALSPPQR